MPVVSTQKVLYKITESCQQQPKNQLADIQREMIATPLMELFPDAPPEAIYHELLRNGLFEPSEWVHLNKVACDFSLFTSYLYIFTVLIQI